MFDLSVARWYLFTDINLSFHSSDVELNSRSEKRDANKYILSNKTDTKTVRGHRKWWFCSDHKSRSRSERYQTTRLPACVCTRCGGGPGRFRVAVVLVLVLPRGEFLQRRRFVLLQQAHDVRAVAVRHRGGHCARLRYCVGVAATGLRGGKVSAGNLVGGPVRRYEWATVSECGRVGCGDAWRRSARDTECEVRVCDSGSRERSGRVFGGAWRARVCERERAPDEFITAEGNAIP